MTTSSNKNRSKRIITRLRKGEAIVVGSIEDFEAIATLFEALAKMEDVYSESERESWINAADHFRSSIDKSVGYFSAPDSDW